MGGVDAIEIPYGDNAAAKGCGQLRHVVQPPDVGRYERTGHPLPWRRHFPFRLSATSE
jgi:hypothetical protein